MQNKNLTKKQEEQKGLSLDAKKEIAKIGMTASLGVVVATSFAMKNKLSKRLHLGAGAALVGFSLWHHLLYQPEKKIFESKKEKDDKTELVPNQPKNYDINFLDEFIEIKIQKDFNKKDLLNLSQYLDSIEKNSKILIKFSTIKNKQKELWNDFIDTIKSNKNIQKCAIYARSMKTLLQDIPSEWHLSSTFRESREWLVS